MQASSRSNSSVSAHRCVALILDAIRRGRINAEERLGARTLARKLGVGLAPVRSALNNLETLGLLERRSRSGTYFRRLSLSEYVDNSRVRAALEGLACRFAAVRATTVELRGLERLAKTLDRLALSAGEHGGTQRGLEIRFHTAVARASRNAQLVSLITAHQFFARYLALEVVLEVPHEFGPPTHGDLVAVLRARDPDRAERLMRQHILGGVYMSLNHIAQWMPGPPARRRELERQLQMLEKQEDARVVNNAAKPLRRRAHRSAKETT